MCQNRHITTWVSGAGVRSLLHHAATLDYSDDNGNFIERLRAFAHSILTPPMVPSSPAGYSIDSNLGSGATAAPALPVSTEWMTGASRGLPPTRKLRETAVARTEGREPHADPRARQPEPREASEEKSVEITLSLGARSPEQGLTEPKDAIAPATQEQTTRMIGDAVSAPAIEEGEALV